MKQNPMTRTVVFAATAIVSTVLAIAANEFTKPGKAPEYEGFGQDFNPDFTDAGKATAIRVVSFDEATAASKMFTVQYKDGWKIPSYHDYPADGKDQLAKAAASVIGLKRGALVTRRKTDHERFGVIDPLDEENPATKGRGTRITLSDKDVPLADFIVGHKVEGSDDKRYVRKFGEDKVYVVSAKFDVSTKFADWAETDLLKVSGFDIVRLRGSRPKINDADEYEGDEVVELTREKSGDPWKLVGLDEAAEELKTDDINTMANTLDDLRLVGVRPRPAFEGKPILNADLKVQLPKELMANPQVRTEIIRVLRSDLGEKGFKVGQDESGQTQLVSREGELTAGTKDGVVYRLTFGSVFSGTEQEIEIGTKEEPKSDSDKKKDGSEKKEDLKKSRYLLVRADFDEKLLGAPPVEPTKPTPPPGVEPPAETKSEEEKKTDAEKKDEAPKKEASDEKKPSEAEKTENGKKSADSKKEDSSDENKGAKGEDTVAVIQDEKKEDAPKAEKSDEKKPADDKKEDAPAAKPKAEDSKKEESKPDDSKKDEGKKEESKPEEPKKDAKAEYLEALKRYDAEKGKFDSETKAFEAKIESGKQKVKELNDRFADWYYVISNDSFDKLRLSRGDLIKKKEKPEGEKKDAEKKEADKSDAEKKDADQPAEKKESEPNKKDADKPAEKSEPKKETKDEKKENEKPSDDK